MPGCGNFTESGRPAILVRFSGHKRIGFTAGLGTHPPVPASPADEGGKEALTRVGVTEGTVDEDLDPDPGLLSLPDDPLYLRERDFPGKYHPGKALRRRPTRFESRQRFLERIQGVCDFSPKLRCAGLARLFKRGQLAGEEFGDMGLGAGDLLEFLPYALWRIRQGG